MSKFTKNPQLAKTATCMAKVLSVVYWLMMSGMISHKGISTNT